MKILHCINLSFMGAYLEEDLVISCLQPLADVTGNYHLQPSLSAIPFSLHTQPSGIAIHSCIVMLKQLGDGGGDGYCRVAHSDKDNEIEEEKYRIDETLNLFKCADSSTDTKIPKNYTTQNIYVMCHMSFVLCHVSHVMWNVSHVTCHLSCLTYFLSYVSKDCI